MPEKKRKTPGVRDVWKYSRMCAAKESEDATNIHVVLPTTDDRFELDVRAMQRVLLAPRVRDRHVAVLSIAGVQRLGKSFILNYLIRYLKSEVHAYTFVTSLPPPLFTVI